MTARITCLLLASTVLAFSASGFAQQTKQGAAPAMHISVTSAKGVQFKNSYRDASGKPISEIQFMKAMQAGSDFVPTLDPAAKTVTLTLTAKGQHGLSILSKSYGNLAIQPGQPLPDFKLSTVGHGEATPNQLVGKPALVDFFFADCVPCMQEVPALNAYAAKHPDMHVLAITFDDAKTASAFVDKRHFRWPVAYDGHSLTDKLQVHEYPTLLLLDAKDHLLASHSGAIPIHYVVRNGKSDRSARADTMTQLHWLQDWVSSKLAGALAVPKVAGKSGAAQLTRDIRRADATAPRLPATMQPG